MIEKMELMQNICISRISMNIVYGNMNAQFNKKITTNIHKQYSLDAVEPLKIDYILIYYHKKCLRGSSRQKWSKLSNFCFLLKKCLQYGSITFQIFRVLAALEPPQNGGQRGSKGGGGSFSIENEPPPLCSSRKWKKYVVHFVGNLSMIPKLFFLF